MSLRLKIYIASASLVLIVVVGMTTSLYFSEKKQLFSEIQQSQDDQLGQLERVYVEAQVTDNTDTVLFNYVQTLIGNPQIAYAGFVGDQNDGWIFPGSDEFPLLLKTMDDKATIDTILKSGKLLRRPTVSPKGKSVIEITKPARNRAYIRLAYYQDVIKQMIDERLARTTRKLMVLGFVAILFGIALAHFLSSAISKPIQKIMKAIYEIAKGKKGITVPEEGQDELGDLARTFNHMSRELVKLDELKDDFMSHVTHELRSPLTSIIATVELMDEMPTAHENPKFHRSIERLKYGSERLNRLVDNILDLTRMEAGKMQFDIQPVNIGKIVTEMADFFEPRGMERNLFIKANVPDSMPMIMADPERIRQVLSNLIHNAIKFTNEGGITLWVREKGDRVFVGVQDTGVGIPKDKIQSIFQKFECLKDTRDRVKKPVPGSGLGLNIVMNSIRSQGGTIWVESEVDKGSTFIFTLPIAKDEPKARSHAAKGERSNQSIDGDGNGRHPIIMEKVESMEKTNENAKSA